jgi:hypothetical protein
MNNKFSSFSILFLILFMLFNTGCINKSHSSVGGKKPKWVSSLSVPRGKTMAVGSSGMTTDGLKSTQRSQAIRRATEEIARQKGVKVENVQQSSDSSTSSGFNQSSMSNQSTHTVSGKMVNVRIVETWYDGAVFYVLMEAY